MIWVSTPVAGLAHASVANAQSTLCPAMYAVISKAVTSLGYSPSAVLASSAAANGCSVVSSLTSAPPRIAYKFFLTIPASVFPTLVVRLYNNQTVMGGHVMCGSTVNFMTNPGSVSTVQPISSANFPQWLDTTQAAGSVCYTDFMQSFIVAA